MIFNQPQVYKALKHFLVMPEKSLIPSNSRINSSELIVLTLARKSPLNAKELHESLEKQGFKASYQAIHKSVQTLKKQGILEEQGNKTYKLSKEWLEKIHELSGKALEAGEK